MTAAQIAPALTRQDIVAGAYEVVHAPELGQIFVAATPSFEPGTPGYIHVLDDGDLHQIRQIQLPRRAFGLALDRTAGRLYVGHTLDGTLGIMDARGGLPIGAVQLGREEAEGGFEHTRMIALDEERGRAFVTSPSQTGVIWVVDTKADTLLHRIDDAGLWTAGAAYDAKAGLFYASGGGVDEISVIDAETGRSVRTISTGDTTEAGGDNSQHFFVNLDIDVEGQRLFAADANKQMLYVFDIESGKVLAQTPTGLGTLDVVFNGARQEVYVSYRGADRENPDGTGGIVVIDAADYAVKARLPLPAHPNSLALGQDGQVLYATVKAPHEETHPEHVAGALDSVVRIDLERLPL